MASTSDEKEEVSNKRKIDDKGEDVGQEKEAKVVDPIADTVLVVNTKVNDTWIRISKTLTEAKVRPCTKYGSGEMRWEYGQYVVVLSVLAYYNNDTKSVVASYRIARYTPLAKYEHFPEDQQVEMIEFLKAAIEQMRGYVARDAVTSYVDSEASHWKDLMRLIVDNPKIPFAPTWRVDCNYNSLRWKRDERSERCVTLARSLDDNYEMRFCVERSRTWEDGDCVPSVYFQEPKEAVAKVEEWLALLFK